MDKNSRILVASPHSLLGSALVRELRRQGFERVIGSGSDAPNFSDPKAVDDFLARSKPEYVFVAGGKSGGIKANQKYPADLMVDNLLLEIHFIPAAFRCGVKKLLYLASSCCYPKHCPQPMKVESLLTGSLEPTNEAYAVAKIAGIKLCQAYRQQHGANFITGIVADIFGPGEHLDLDDLHVVPALLLRMQQARKSGAGEVVIWGTGNPRREFIFADDVADACIFAMQHYDDSKPLNVGGGVDLSIRQLAEMIKEVVGYTGSLVFDSSKPDGMPLKILDSSKLRSLGWKPRTDIRSGLAETLQWLNGIMTAQPR